MKEWNNEKMKKWKNEKRKIKYEVILFKYLSYI